MAKVEVAVPLVNDDVAEMEPVTDDARSWKLMGDGGIGRRRVPGTALGAAGFFDQIARFFWGQWPQVRPSHHTTINRVAATATPTDINISAFWLTFKATSSRQMKEASETKTLLHSRRGLMSRGLGQLLVGASDVARTENRCHGHRQNCSSDLFLENIACVNLLACAQSNVGHSRS